MASMFMKSGLLAVTASVLESKYVAPHGLTYLEGITPLIAVGTGLWTIMHGFLVIGPARKKYMELAKKDGEKDVEERFELPNIYAQGTSIHVRKFNCVQRSHQHIFETFTQVMIAAMVSWRNYPVSSALGLAVYAIGRYQLTKGYAASEGVAGNRYQSALAFGMWYGILMLHVLGGISAVKMILGDQMY